MQINKHNKYIDSNNSKLNLNYSYPRKTNNPNNGEKRKTKYYI